MSYDKADVLVKAGSLIISLLKSSLKHEKKSILEDIDSKILIRALQSEFDSLDIKTADDFVEKEVEFRKRLNSYFPDCKIKASDLDRLRSLLLIIVNNL